MIPRYLRVIYWLLVAAIVGMGFVLAFSRQRDHARMVAMRDASPIAAPTDIPNEQASIATPNDADGSVAMENISLALPAEPSMRARVILERLLTKLALPASTHPVPSGPAITDVFFLSLPIRNPAAVTTDEFPVPVRSNGVQLAVVNLTKAFAEGHASGIETEDLTLRAIIATLHANFPEIAQVRFLVDGKPRDTLNGHADLSRAYGVTNAEHSVHTVASSQ